MTLVSAELLTAWEAAAAEPPVDRAPALLQRLGRLPEGIASVGELTVGGCDALLFQLRQALFGDELEAVATCPGCGDDVEFTVRLHEIAPALDAEGGRPPEPVRVEDQGYTVESRLPRNADLRLLADLGSDADVVDLLDSCVATARAPDGAPVAPRDLPASVRETVAASLAERDPGARVLLGVRCDCGAEWVDELDIRSVLWAELTEWVGQTLDDVQQLARVYGWSEADILAMTPWRRRWYLEAAW